MGAERRRSRGTPPEPVALPEHVTLPLLTKITRDSLDEDYQHVALRNQQSGGADSARTASAWSKYRYATIAAGVVGLLLVVSALQTERQAATTERGREELISQIQDRREKLADTSREINDLRRSNDTGERQLDRLVATEESAEEERLRLGAVTGYVPVSGEGVEITVEDSAAGDDDGRVRDEDLAVLFNGLWAAGAEAIALNGLRVTNLTGIRNTGKAPHLAARPLKPPYKIQAVGDSSRLQADFANTPAGAEWYNLVASFGFEFSMENADSLSLPGREIPALTYARDAAPEGKDQ